MLKHNKGRIKKISGPLIVAENLIGVKMNEVVRVGKDKLIGEVVELSGNEAAVQVYEETSGLRPGEEISATGAPLSVELGPGLIGSIYDGMQRPLDTVMASCGNFIKRGVEIFGLDKEKKWDFKPSAEKGIDLSGGMILGEVEETSIIVHKIMVPPQVRGKLADIKEGSFKVDDVIAVIEDEEGNRIDISMFQKWPVRLSRPYKQRFQPSEPLISGQRVIDTFFPIAKGGVASIPGPFGSGKTVVQQQLAKWTDADIVVYIGCGERGNEMTDVLQEFPELEDPNTGEPLIKRTVLIANTSNMPVAAREASIYTGTTIAEYFRDMGYKVALMADSTSRWAEALREMSGRLEEMPGEEGYPAYLSSRIAEFYERAGQVECLGGGRQGSLSIIGAVSPPGGDLSDAVVKNTLRVVKVFWGLDDELSSQRHFPAIHWLRSYSLYLDNISAYMSKEIAEDFIDNRNSAMAILQKEESLQEIVRLVGEESLSSGDRQIMDTAKIIREDFLQQHAFDPIETFTPIRQQYLMLKAVIKYHVVMTALLEDDVEFGQLPSAEIKAKIAKMKYVAPDKLKELEDLIDEIYKLKEGKDIK